MAASDHNTGHDKSCKLALYSICSMPTAPIEVELAARKGFGNYLKVAQDRGFWNPSLSGSRSGVAAAFGCIHGGDGISPAVCQVESSPRNASFLDKFLTHYEANLVGQDNEIAPFVLLILDNSKGPGDTSFLFAGRAAERVVSCESWGAKGKEQRAMIKTEERVVNRVGKGQGRFTRSDGQGR